MALTPITEETPEEIAEERIARPAKEVIEERAEELSRIFNRKPKDAIKTFMQICGGDENTASKEIADFFLKYRSKLDLELVGDFLGTESEIHFQSMKKKKTDEKTPEVLGINELVRENFANKFDFKGVGIVQGMRDFLSGFKLPGEGQKIGRIVETFAREYYKSHTSDFNDMGAVEVLAFANIMLNTDLHSTNIPDEKKMSYLQFSKNLRGENGRKDFSEALLQAIYGQIKENPFKLNFTKEAVGITLEAAGPKGQDLFSKITSTNTQEFLTTSLKIDETTKIDVKTPSSWLKAITGFTTDIKVQGPNGNVHIQAYKPGWFSKKEPTIIICPLDSDEKSLELSAKISANFNCPIKSIKANFDYEKEEIIQTMSTTYQAMGVKSHTLEHIPKPPQKTISRSV